MSAYAAASVSCFAGSESGLISSCKQQKESKTGKSPPRAGIRAPHGGTMESAFCSIGMAGIEKDAFPDREELGTIDPEEIIRKTTQEKPAHSTHWTTRTLARVLGTGRRCYCSTRLACPRLKPHLVDTFKVSRELQFIEKLEDTLAVLKSTTAGHRVFGGREESDSSFDRTPASACWMKKRPQGHHDPRLQASRNHHIVCGPQHSPVWFSASAGLDIPTKTALAFPRLIARVLQEQQRSM